MAILSNLNAVFYENATAMNAKQPMQTATVCVVATKDYIFMVPQKTLGFFLVLNTITNHRLFEGVSIIEGVKKLIANSEDTNMLEQSFCELLDNDERYVHRLTDKTSFKFRGFLGKHTLRMAIGLTNWSSVSPNGKGNSKEFRQFYGQ